MSPRVRPVCVLLSFFLTPLFPWISWASSVTASPPLTSQATLTAVSCEDCLVLVEVVVFVLVEVCLGNITLEGLRLNIVRNTSDIVRLDL